MPRRDKEDDWGEEEDQDLGKGKKKRRDWQRKDRQQEGEEGEPGDQAPPATDRGSRR